MHPVVATTMQSKPSRAEDDRLTSRQNAYANTAHMLFCLQEEHDAAFTSTPALRDGKHWQTTRTRKGRNQDAAAVTGTAALTAKNGAYDTPKARNPARLWKNACISTGRDVQKAGFASCRRFCPTSVQHRYRAFPAYWNKRKPLTL